VGGTDFLQQGKLLPCAQAGCIYNILLQTHQEGLQGLAFDSEVGKREAACSLPSS